MQHLGAVGIALMIFGIGLPGLFATTRFVGGKLVDLLGDDHKRADNRGRQTKSRTSGSFRLVKQVMLTDVPRFDETATLSELMEFFTGDGSPFAIVVRDRLFGRMYLTDYLSGRSW